ncbi:MAG: tyrosine--tRNA ligase, partial [Lachnospiraceae bacterium]|nr:tyrosine--tRNA ligase [Lachnospiraceae bacterium]
LTYVDFPAAAIVILSILVQAELAASKSEARRNVVQGGVSLDGKKVDDFKLQLTAEEIGDGVVLRRGKKKYCKVVVKK